MSGVLAFAKQRLAALFFVVLIIFGASSQTVIAFAAASSAPSAADTAGKAHDNKSPHKTSTTPSVGTINATSPTAPSVLQPSKFTAAADAKPLSGKGSGPESSSFLDKVSGTVLNQPLAPLSSPSKPTFTPHELVGDRTETSSAYLNKDGTITRTNYFSPHYYQNNGSWQLIDNTLIEDDNAADSTNVLGKALGKVESAISNPNAYQTQGNSWIARFTPSDFSGGMVRVKQGGSQIGFSPINANVVNPVISTDSKGNQTVLYGNLWNGVDVTYRVQSDEVKESIVIKNKGAVSKVQFKMVGATLHKPGTSSSPGKPQPTFTIQGALGDKFGIAPANLLLSHFGYVDDKATGLSQSYSSGTLSVGVDSSYLQQLPGKAFPVVIDPSITSPFGTTGEGSYLSFESNGTMCYPSTCDLYAGGLYDSSSAWQDWRGALYASFTRLQGIGISLTNANLHLSGINTVSGGTWNYQVGEATCLTAYSCMDHTWDSANLSNATGDIDVTDIYQDLITHGKWGNWLMIDGADGTGNSSFADFNADASYVTFTYTTALPSPTIQTPQAGQVFTDPQPSFKVNTETNPNGSTPLQYEFRITDGADGTGEVITETDSLNSTSWTIPDGMLQNGSTYYVSARSIDSTLNYNSPFSTPVPFTIDMREGQNKTQTYDTAGSAKVDLATGNLQTGTASHATKAIGGDMGVNLDYSSPIKSRPGLVASYWNVASGYSGGAPTTAPDLTRVDQNIDFNWNGNSPGSSIGNTWFFVQWSGYFVAPAAGTYYFGGLNDDSLTVTVNGASLYSNSGCSSGPCYGSSITLAAGQVVSFQATYLQATGADYAHVYVKGPGAGQIVPAAWFQTGVRQLQQHGLVGHYYSYAYAGTAPTFPSNGTDGLFLTRTDPAISFGWYGNVPVSNGPEADWMVRWTGYLTVPATGSYTFGAFSDQGSSITIDGTQVYNAWTSGVHSGYGTAVSLTAGQSVPIQVDYYQHTSQSTRMYLEVEPLGGAGIVVPSAWLTPQAQILPSGWQLGFDPDGALSYTHLTANTYNVILSDTSGDTFDYTWNGSGYTPPPNGHGFLVRNEDGSFTLQDSDGKTYVFDVAGNLSSVTSPTDDGHQASLQYSFGSAGSGGPTSIQQITDATNSNRWMKVYYSGASQCGSAPSGFYSAPGNMLCAAQTNDGRTTYFYYDQYGNLAEVLRPGNDATQYQYQAVLNPDSSVMGYQLVGIRDSLANDAIAAGVRSNDATTYTAIQYDALGRVTSVTVPAATSGATRQEKTYNYYIPQYGQVPLNRYYNSTAHERMSSVLGTPAGYSLESVLGYLQIMPTTGTRALYSCKNTWDLFTSSDSNCEGHSTYDGFMGYAYYPSAPSGMSSVAVYRCIGSGDSFNSTHSDCEGQTFDGLLGYLLTSPTPTIQSNYTDVHVTGATEPKGYSQEVLYDSNFRTTQVYNDLGLAATNEWDPVKDLLYSTTNAEGLMTTTIYDDEDRPITHYGPAPASWFNHPSYTLANGQSLAEGQSLVSPDGRFSFTFQTDGNVVLSGPNGTMWSTGTSGQTATDLTMTWDGNLVEYNGSTAIGATNTYGNGTSTHLVVQNDGNAVLYTAAGPIWSTNTGGWGPSATASTYGTPVSGHTNDVARADAAYDGGMTGLAVSYTDVNEPVANRASLSGAPLLHSTNIATNGTITHDWSTTAPVTTSSGKWGFSMTGAMRLPSTGNWTISPTQDGGIRMWIDGQLVIDNWRDNTTANTTKTESYTYNNTVANSVHQVRIDYYHLAVTSDATFSLAMTPPGGSSTTSVASYFSPNYGLTTTTTAYDATIGNTTATVDYGSTPELGLPTSAAVDPTGLDLTGSSTYEAPGTGYGRQTSTTTPGGSTTTYSYYSASDTAANPCVTSSPTAYQAGMLKTETGPSPDGGTTPGKAMTVVYDDAGRIVATKTNSDGWECKTYDARGRLTEDDVPAYNGNAARTVTYNYNVSSNPLVTSVTDSSGTVTTIIDLLGRTVSYTNNLGDTTTTAFDSLGRVQSQTSPIGSKTFTYDNYNRVTDEKLGTTDLAQSSYDSYGRLDAVTYPSAGTMQQAIGYDSATGAENSITYTTSDTTSVNDAVTLTQSGKVQYDVVSSGSSSLWYGYGYDKAGRLMSADIGPHAYAYGYGTENSSCASGTNTNAGKSGNRTSQTIDGTSMYYCYNDADQLVGSSDASADAAQYDSHGNTTEIGSGSDPLRLYYDSSDRNWGMVQYDGSGNGNATYYSQDALNRMYYREHDTISSWNWNMDGQYWYGYTSGSGGPAYVYDSAWDIIEEYVQLPGGAVMTIRPQRSGGAPYYMLPNIHGDTLLLADGTGANMSNGNGPDSTFTYDPFGNALPGGATPNDTDYGSFGYKGAAMKVTETTLSLNPILMGARIYLPSLGRFASEDPIPGGNANTYAYALDPINFADLSGLSSGCAILCISLGPGGLQGGAGAAQLQPTVSSSQVVHSVAKTSSIKVAASSSRAQAPQNTSPAPAPVSSIAPAGPPPTPFRNFTPASNLAGGGSPPVGTPFSLVNAAQTAVDYYGIGEGIGITGGCLFGEAVDVLGGCIFGGMAGGPVVGIPFAIWGFIQGGGYNNDVFDTGAPDGPDPWPAFK